MLNDKAREFLRLERFLSAYCPSVTNVKHKLRGTDGNKKPIDFTAEDKAAIRQGLQKLAKELLR